MAVDRGELRYKIAIEDNFTNPIQRFRTELLKAKNTLEFVKDSTTGFRNLTRDVSSATTEMRRFRQTSSQGVNEERQANQETVRRLREIAAEQKKRNSVEKLRADILKQQRVEAEKAAAAERRAAKEAEAAQKRATQATRSHAAAAKDLNKSLLGTESNTNRVAFTFRRLFGILAAFTVARQVVSSFTSLVGASIQFNRTVEDSAVGLASLFVASGQVKNEFGQIVTGAEAFKIAQQEAVIQGRKLRQDALLTTATYEELLVAFQAAVGPGLAAGLNLDQVRQVAVNISQAAAAFGLEQNQLAEEVRSLITGTGQLRTTRLAQVISNEDIRNARAAGKLFELLTTRLKPFALAAEVTQKNFSGLVARLQDAVGLAAGGAGLAFFTELKGLLADLGDLFIEVEKDAKGVITAVTPDPRAVQTLALVFDGLKQAVETIRAGVKTIDLREAQNALALIAVGFRAVAAVAVGFVRGLVGGLSDVAVLAQRFFGAFNSPLLQEATALVTRLGTLMVAASLAASALLGTVRLLIAPFTLLVNLGINVYKAAAATLGVIKKVPAGLGIWAGLLAGIVLGFEQVFQSILGVDLTIGDTVDIIVLSFETAFGQVVRFGEIVFKNFANVLVGIFTDPLGTIAGLFSDLFSGVLQVASGLAAVLGISEDFRASIESAVSTFDRIGAKVKPKPIFDTAKDRADLDQFVTDSQKKFDELSAGIATRNANKDFEIKPNVDTGGISDDLTQLLRDVNASVAGLIGGDIVDEKGIAEKLAKVGEEITKRLGEITGKQQEAQLTAFDKMIQGLITRSEGFLNVLQSAVQGFADFASSAIVDAFDPTKDVDLRERFARLLQDIAKQILQTLFTLLIATAIAKAFGVPLPSNNESVPNLPTFAEGGSVPDSGSPIPRPASVPKSDTTLAWLTPGEVVQSLDAVRRYGADFLLALNEGAIDLMALRSLAGLEGRRSVRRTMARSGALAFAAGGLVPAAGVQQTRQEVAQAGDAAGQPPIALVVGNEQSLDRLLAGGKRSMLDFMRANAGAIDGILSKNRT